MTARIAPAHPPFSADIQSRLDQVMKGKPPLALFTTLARDERLFMKFFNAGLLDRGHLSLRQREIVIHRVTALCGSEYEWGMHAAIFAAHAGLDAAQLGALTHGDAQDPHWTTEERCLVRLCDALHAECSIDDALWAALRTHFSEEAMLELLMLAGFYRTVSYLTNALRLPLETNAARFDSIKVSAPAPGSPG